MIKVLVVDDSMFICKAITRILEKDPHIKVVGVAHDGEEAIKKIKELDPDLVTLDVEMPKMDGLSALRIIMKEMPRPVIMISSLTREGAKTTLEAMSLGAVDFIPKELYQSATVGIDLEKIERQLLEKIRAIGAKKAAFVSRPSLFSASKLKPASSAATTVTAPPSVMRRKRVIELMVIGVSTGGPTALQKLIPALPKNIPVPGIIVQHMPPAFTGPLADRLNALGGPRVKEAEQGERLEPGKFLVVPGAYHMQVRKIGSQASVMLTEEPKDSVYHPSIDITLSSAAEAFKERTLAVILTGMGKDGLEGARRVKQYGGKVLAQDEASSIVYGMPKVVIEAGLADKVVSLDDMAKAIVEML